ncbi:MAG: DNA polymerase III subunit beta [Alphaproteobacteria bacterium CG11_big_fil_rev_8_21_14_0_20_44_7]|nr:MAG: DNA polymerase III subunit beta [Alphaproteobacteria bacterium CG11_big_fil_rev_8_21_14_0_20_44_7]
MKFTVERSIILKSLSHIQSVVEKRNTIPVLSNVKLEADGDSIRLTATDTEISITETIPAKISEAASITLPAQMLYEIIRKLPEGAEVEFVTSSNGQIEVKAGRSKFKLLTLPVDQFPVMEQGELPHNFTLSSKDLLALIDKVRFAISNEETRYYLNGVYLHVTEDGDDQLLRSAATDGHRLARITLNMPQGAENMPGIIIPKKTVGELKKLLAEFSEEVKIAVSDTKIKFILGSVVVTSKLIDGKFPDYERVIPHANDKILEVNTKLFAEAVDRVSTVSFEKARAIKLSVDTGKVIVSADSADGNTADEELEASYSADAIETGYNFRYMLDMMNQIEGETAQFMLADSASPALVRDPSDVSVLYVIMPMRV